MSEKNNILYQYLLFIWKKKFYLIGFTIFCMVVAAILSYNPKPIYTSTALVFTGNAKNDKITKPHLIVEEYEEEISKELRNSFDAKIKEDFQITLTLSGENKEIVEKELKKVTEKYTNELKTRYNEQYDNLQNLVQTLEEREKKIKEEIKYYDQMLTKETNEELLTTYMILLEEKAQRLDKYIDDLHEANAKLVLFESPELMDITTVASKNNLLRNTLLGGAFGFQLMLIILVLWKYIIDARRTEK